MTCTQPAGRMRMLLCRRSKSLMCLDCFSRDMVHMGGQMVTDGWTASDECTVAVLQLTPDFIKNSCCRPTDGAVDRTIAAPSANPHSPGQ